MAIALLSSISVGDRRREDLGDIDGLAASIARYGLLHPIVVDDDGNLIAGGRRLEACRRLKWDEIPVTWLGDLSEAERREIELEENLRRKDLSPYEQAKVMVGLGAVAGEVLKQQSADFLSDSDKKSRGQPKKPNGQVQVAERLGIAQSTLSEAQRHVETADEHPFMQGPGWKQYHVLEARTHLERLPEEDRLRAANLIDQPATPPRQACEILKNLAAMPDQERQRVLSLNDSPDIRDKSLALTAAAQRPPMPDPRPNVLDDARALLRKVIRAFPNDPETPRLEAMANELREMAKTIREVPRGN